MAGLCGDCTGCCEVFEVRSLSKPSGHMCKHQGKILGGTPGCTIYADRPPECQFYVCLWLDSQRRDDVESMPESMRPDNSHVVMGQPGRLEAETLHFFPFASDPRAWQRGEISNQIKMVLSRGGKVVIWENSQRIIAMKGDIAVVGTEAEYAEVLNRPEFQLEMDDAAQ